MWLIEKMLTESCGEDACKDVNNHIFEYLNEYLNETMLTEVCGEDACQDGDNHWDQVGCEAARAHQHLVGHPIQLISNIQM